MNVIPADPDYVPSDTQAAAALKRLVELVNDAEYPKFQIHASPQFVDIGEWMDSVQCPECENIVDPFEPYDEALHDWFSELRSLVKAGPGTAVTLPQCGHTSTAEDLRFRCPTGYARTVLTVCNPLETFPPVDQKILSEIGEILGCEVREVWGHF